jgi:Na+/H+ antiporter NhaD/arsenite permease-like protein
MMIIVSILSETGVFNWMGLWAFKISKGKVWPLLTILCLITALVSAVLDNVTTILLMTPIVIQLCETINIGDRKINFQKLFNFSKSLNSY